MPFCQFTAPWYEAAPHLVEITNALEAVRRRDMKFLLVVTPPRHGKTETVSIRFPSWVLGNDSEEQIMSLSYSDALAYSNSLAVRTIIQGPEYQELWPLKFKTTGVMEWQLEGKRNLRPSYIAAGVGSGIVGKGSSLMVADDLTKNRQEAESPTYRERVWGWYGTTARTRLEPNGRVIGVTTRWHEDDWAGRILKNMVDPLSDQWHVIHLKAIDEGQALWPERYPIEALENIRATIGSRDFETIYQGNPTVAAGTIFKRDWFKFIDVEAMDEMAIDVSVQVYDTAFKSGQENDYSVCLTMHLTDRGFIVSDMWHERVEFPALESTVETLYRREQPAYVLVEDAASGQSLIQALQTRSRVPVMAVQAKGDKVSRANSITGLVESGRVSLVNGPWNHDFLEELCSFPSGAHDDIVDAFVHGMTFLREYAGSDERDELQVGAPRRSKWR